MHARYTCKIPWIYRLPKLKHWNLGWVDRVVVVCVCAVELGLLCSSGPSCFAYSVPRKISKRKKNWDKRLETSLLSLKNSSYTTILTNLIWSYCMPCPNPIWTIHWIRPPMYVNLRPPSYIIHHTCGVISQAAVVLVCSRSTFPLCTHILVRFFFCKLYMHVDQTVSKATVVLVCRDRREICHRPQPGAVCWATLLETLGLSLSLQNRNCEPIDCASLTGGPIGCVSQTGARMFSGVGLA